MYIQFICNKINGLLLYLEVFDTFKKFFFIISECEANHMQDSGRKRFGWGDGGWTYQLSE